MSSFKERSYKKELLDRDDIPFEEIVQNMKELDVINSRLGGHRITLEGLWALLKGNTNEVIHVVEIGCGGGDNLRIIKEWGLKNGFGFELTGIDINPECIVYAKKQEGNAGIDFICSDYINVKFETNPHIIFSSLFCHHFINEELVFMLRWMQQNSTLGFFINDLQRHPLAYHSIKLLTRLFSKSRLVKNDAPLSVKRGFTKRDWEKLFAAAGISNFTCRWKWAFRWLIYFKHE